MTEWNSGCQGLGTGGRDMELIINMYKISVMQVE